MFSYFKPLRRKIGVGMLAVACLLLVGWVRSTTGTDFVVTRWSRSSFHIESGFGRVEFARRTPATQGPFLSYGSIGANGSNEKPFNYWDHLKAEWRWDWLGFHFGAGRNTAGTIRLIEIWIVPYYAMVVPLTLLSAWLLVSTPRAKRLPNDRSVPAP